MRTALVVTGMHRSGTSLLANLLREAGVAVGDRLYGPNAFNPKGHFEDEEFLDLHEAILKFNGTTWALHDAPDELRISDEHRARARELVARRSGQHLWGWKDPRTVLFLDLWHGLLREAKFIFIFRPATLVVESLRRRLDFELSYHGHGAWTLHKIGLDSLRFRLHPAVELWLRYNRDVIRFARQHPHQSCVIAVEQLIADFPGFLARLRNEWGAPVQDIDLKDVFESRLLHGKVSWRVARACRRHAEVAAVYDQLLSLADR